VRVNWDPPKSAQNLRKHGVSFDEAAELLTSGVDYLEIYDEMHSDAEDRFIAIGPVARGLVLVVYTERGIDTIRIISARWATKREANRYREYADGDRK
jgi:uncharacterized DUF497 family protein